MELSQNALMFWLENILNAFFAPDTSRKVLVAALAGIPLFVGGIGCIVTGLITPWLNRVLRDVVLARKLLAVTGFTGAGVLLVTSLYIRDPLLAMLAMGAASFCNDLTMPGSWSTCMDIGGRYAGTLSGSMNMMGSFGGMLAPLAIGLILDYSDRNWAITFWLAGSAYLLGAICWLGLDPATPIAEDEPAVSPP